MNIHVGLVFFSLHFFDKQGLLIYDNCLAQTIHMKYQT